MKVEDMSKFDISNEAWREYMYPDGSVLRVVGAVTMLLDKRNDGDRHRLIVKENDKEVGMYIKHGWLAIRWQTPDGKHGIEF
jgi:hypothetical protein